MKTFIYIFVVCALCTSCFAQTALKEGQHTYDGKTFDVKRHTYLERTSISVSAIGRFYDKRPPLPKDPNGLPVKKKDVHFDIEKVKGIVNNVLASKRDELNRNNDRIDLSFAFLKQDGSIEYISYFLNGNTLIKLEDIAKIDMEIKRNVKATYTGNEHANFYLINYGNVNVKF